MEFFSYIVRDAAPSYLKSVPIPKSFGGFTNLSGMLIRLFYMQIYNN